MRFIVLTTLLTILIPTISATETTNNLVSQDFTTGWTNTGNSTHGSSTIAGIHGGTVTSDSVSLTDDVGLNKNEINQGFTVNSSANVWFWNNYDQSVTMTTQAIDDNGQTITQNRTLSGTCATWNGCDFGTMSDTMIFNSNTQADYNLSLGFSFSVTDPTYQSGHYAADLKDPSMTVTYTPINLDSTTETALLDLNKNIKDELKNVSTVEIKEETKITDTKVEQSTTTQLTENKVDQDSTSMTTTQENQSTEQVKEETKEEQSKEEAPSENKEDSKTAQSNTESKDTEKKENGSKDVALNKDMQKVDEKVKDIESNMKIKQNLMINAMVDNSLLKAYNIPFYKEKKIYEDQKTIRDDRIIYQTNLNSYMERDPILIQQREIFNIRMEKQKLLNEIEVLKNG